MKEWDSAASYCIISEAGGKMTDMLGNDLTYNNKDVDPGGQFTNGGKLSRSTYVFPEFDTLGDILTDFNNMSNLTLLITNRKSSQ